MENKYFKISKESVWWGIKHVIGMLILYIVYIRFMPFGTHEITVSRTSLVNFVGWIAISSLMLLVIYIILVEFVGYVIRLILTKVYVVEYGGFFSSIPEFTVRIPVVKSMLDRFDEKFDRKPFKYPDGTSEKEGNYNFCKRIISKLIDEQLKGGTEKLKISGTILKGGKKNERKK